MHHQDAKQYTDITIQMHWDKDKTESSLRWSEIKRLFNDIHCAKHASLRRKSKFCLARNHVNTSEWSDWTSTIQIQQSVLV